MPYGKEPRSQSDHKPAMVSSTALIVPEDQLTRVSGMNATLQGIPMFVSPALGAFLLAVLHVLCHPFPQAYDPTVTLWEPPFQTPEEPVASSFSHL